MRKLILQNVFKRLFSFFLRDAVTDDTKRTRVINHDEIRIQRGFQMNEKNV